MTHYIMSKSYTYMIILGDQEIDFLGVLSKAIISAYSWSYGTSDSHAAIYKKN